MGWGVKLGMMEEEAALMKSLGWCQQCGHYRALHWISDLFGCRVEGCACTLLIGNPRRLLEPGEVMPVS